MESAVALDTVFGILVPNPTFEFSFPLAVVLIVVCVGAWILTAVDIRRKRPNNVPTEEEIDREFQRLLRSR